MREHREGTSKFNGWEMLRDVLVGAIDTGQIIPVGTMFLLALIIWRLPEDTLAATLTDTLASFKNGSLLGWILFIGAIIAWRIQYCSIRDMHTNEMSRVAAARDAAQQTHAALPLGSSDAPQITTTNKIDTTD